MNRNGAWVVAAAVLITLLFATVSTSGGVGLWIEPQWEPTLSEPAPIEIDGRFGPGDEAPPVEEERHDPIVLPAWVIAVLRVIMMVIAFGVGVALVMAGWRNRPRVRWRQRSTGDGDFEVLPDIAAAVVEQAAAQRAALLGGAPRNAIVRCWLRLEGDVAAAGLTRDPADTSIEFTERVLGRYAVDPEAITDLAALYREARFSDHPLEESHRLAALDALDRLHHTLADGAIGAAP